MKTYTIYTKIGGVCRDEYSHITGFSQLRKTFAEGAMAMAEAHYGGNRYFQMRCDQTGEIIETIEPRKIHLN